MPYIPKKIRPKLDFFISELIDPKRCALLSPSYEETINELIKLILDEGELNYTITKLCWDFWKKDPCYTTGNTIVECFERTSARAFCTIEPLNDLDYFIYEIISGVHNRPIMPLVATQGVLRCAQLEFYRRVLAPYEDKKRKQNGDVYEN